MVSGTCTYLFTRGCIHLGGACGASHLRTQAYMHVHMGSNCGKKRGIPEKHNKLQGLLDPPRGGADRVGMIDCLCTSVGV